MTIYFQRQIYPVPLVAKGLNSGLNAVKLLQPILPILPPRATVKIWLDYTKCAPILSETLVLYKSFTYLLTYLNLTIQYTSLPSESVQDASSSSVEYASPSSPLLLLICHRCNELSAHRLISRPWQHQAKQATVSYVRSTHCVPKNIPDIFDRNLKTNYQIVIIFGMNIPYTTCHQMTIQFPTSPNVCFCTTWGKQMKHNMCWNEWINVNKCHLS